MPYSRPTLTQLDQQAIQDITTSGVPGLDGLLRNAVLRVLAWVMAALAYGVYGYADWIARMAVPFTAEDEFLYAWAALIGIYPKDAVPATGQAQFTGQPGKPIPEGTALTRQDGTPYTTTAEASVDTSGTVIVPFVAAVKGAATNCDAGTVMSISGSIHGINSGGLTVGPTTGGADQETNDELRSRMLAKYRQPPQGGAVADYIQWALEVPGVTRAWAQPQGYGAGSVVVRFMMDDAQAEHGGFPQGTDGCATDETRAPTATGDQLAVADHIWPVQPVTSLVYAASPVPHPIDVVLVALSPNTAEIQQAIIDSITDMYLIKATVGGTIYPSDLYEAILTTPELVHFTMSEPQWPVTVAAGELPVMGNLSVMIAAV